jgi:hypothetical protein
MSRSLRILLRSWLNRPTDEKAKAWRGLADMAGQGEAYELTAEESQALNSLGRRVSPEAQVGDASLDNIISWYIDDDMPDVKAGAEWAAVVAARARLGRPLNSADVRSVVSAYRSVNRDL